MGDSKAQEIVYNRYSNSVKNFLKNKYLQYYDLDDDVSEIMIKIFTKLQTFDETKSKFSSWVFSIAKNYVIDKWRCSGCSNTLQVDGFDYTISSSTSSSDNNYLTSSNTELQVNSTITSCNTDFENCSSINYISSQLSPQDFTLLEMKYVQGYDYYEIGNEFNLTSSTVSNRVNYIKTKLKKNNPEIIYN